MAWKLIRISSGRWSIENSELYETALPEVISKLENALGGRMKFGGRLGIAPALAASAIELTIDGVRITLGYDNWSGVYIMAWDEGGDRIIEDTILNLFKG